MRFGELHRSAQVQLSRTQDQTFFGDPKPAESIGFFDVQNHFFINKKFVVQGQVVAVGIAVIVRKRTDANVRS
jgi:hypothetical protein